MNERVVIVEQFRSKPDAGWYDVAGKCWPESIYRKFVYQITLRTFESLWLWVAQQSDVRLVRRTIHEEVILTTETMHE